MPDTRSLRRSLPPDARIGASEALRLADGTAVRLHATEPETDDAMPEDERAGIIACDLEGRTVGTVGYERIYGPRAEVRIAVDADYWHRGLPEVLLASLRLRAARVGIATLLLRIPAGDLALLALLRTEFCSRGHRRAAHPGRDPDHPRLTLSGAPRRRRR